MTHAEPARPAFGVRWTIVGVFVAATALSYLDRQLLAAAAPLLKQEFGLSNLQYGQLIAVFSIVYALTTPLAGVLIDRIGLRRSAPIAVLLWSAAGVATGFAGGLASLLACRVALAVGESASIPAATKASATYLHPRELGLGTAAGASGMTLGLMAAPLLMGIAGPRLGWRGSFVISGALGLVWAAVWLITARRVPSSIGPASAGTRVDMTLLRDRRLWLITIASALVMTVPSLWTNWTTIYFVQEHHLSLVDANRQFAWIPPLFATIGAFVGGSLAFRKIGRDGDAVQARFAICKAMAPLLLGTAAAPFVSSTTLAALAIAVGFGASMAIANNLQMIPVGVFGPERAAFTGAVLTCSFALMQTLVSPFIGVAIDSYGFAVVCVTMSALSLLGVLTLAVALRGERDASPRVAVFAARQAAPTADGVGQ